VHRCAAVNRHAPEQVLRFCAVGFGVNKIPPAAYALAYQQAEHAEVKHIQNIQLFDFAVDKGADEREDNRAVNRDSAVPYLKHGYKIAFELAVIEYHIVKPRADYRAGCGYKHHIYQVVARYAELRASFKAVKNGEGKPQGYYNAVPAK
jgi:hypothetical protein